MTRWPDLLSYLLQRFPETITGEQARPGRPTLMLKLGRAASAKIEDIPVGSAAAYVTNNAVNHRLTWSERGSLCAGMKRWAMV
jgi:hypothetical protein